MTTENQNTPAPATVKKTAAKKVVTKKSATRPKAQPVRKVEEKIPSIPSRRVWPD